MGYNYGMTEVQSVLGLSQLNRIDEYVRRRRELAIRYDNLLEDLPVRLPWQHPETRSAFHLYVIRLNLDRIARTRLEVFSSLREQGIGVNVHYIPVHTQPHYANLGQFTGSFPESDAYYSEAISLPMFATLSDDQQESISLSLRRALGFE